MEKNKKFVSKKICKYWLSNKCRFAQSCKFSHDPNNNTDCSLWLQGHCHITQCKFKHDPKRQSKTSIISSPFTMPDVPCDGIGLILLKYYLDASLFLGGISINKSIVSIISEYCTDVHHSNIKYINNDIRCRLCQCYDYKLAKCNGCGESETSKMGIVILGYNFFVVCKDPICLIRLGITLKFNTSGYKKHTPVTNTGKRCCSGFISLLNDLTVKSCRQDDMFNGRTHSQMTSYSERNMRTAHAFGFKFFPGSFTPDAGGSLQWIFSCTCSLYKTIL